MQYELTLSSERDITRKNLVFNSDIPIMEGDQVMGFYVNTRNFIINKKGEIEKIILDNFEYYRENNQRFWE